MNILEEKSQEVSEANVGVFAQGTFMWLNTLRCHCTSSLQCPGRMFSDLFHAPVFPIICLNVWLSFLQNLVRLCLALETQ